MPLGTMHLPEKEFQKCVARYHGDSNFREFPVGTRSRTRDFAAEPHVIQLALYLESQVVSRSLRKKLVKVRVAALE